MIYEKRKYKTNKRKGEIIMGISQRMIIYFSYFKKYGLKINLFKKE